MPSFAKEHSAQKRYKQPRRQISPVDLSLLLGRHGLGQWMLESSSGLAGMEAIPDVSQQTLFPG